MSKHMKKLAAPRTWRIPRKTHVWVVKPSPGPHPVERGIPLLVVVRDILRLCETGREGRRIIGGREVMVDGKVVTNSKHPVGMMDVVSLPRTKENYRMLLNKRNKLTLVNIDEGQSKWKLVRIEDKTTLRRGKTQLNLHDGRNMLLEKNQYKTGDVLKIELPSQKIMNIYPLAEGNVSLLTGGKHVGELATVASYKVRRGREPNIVTFKEGFNTVKDNVFVVGFKAPEVQLPEVRAI